MHPMEKVYSSIGIGIFRLREKKKIRINAPNKNGSAPSPTAAFV